VKGKNCKPYLFFILLSLAVGGLSSFAVAKGMPAYQLLYKPPLTPPSIVFPIVWTLLYILMGVSAARVWLTGSEGRGHAIDVFALQLVLNFFWSIWFFGLQALLFSFMWLLALIIAILWMIRVFSQIDPLAGRLQIPYLLWCTFAAYLNFCFWFLNR